MAVLTESLLTGYEGRSMRDICPFGYDATDDNHCAHFVAHALQLDFGMTCARLKGRRGAAGAANVRVHEIFAECPHTRELLECPMTGKGLVFVSEARNFSGKPARLRNIPKKHIGIALDGQLWHYSNPRNRVVRQHVSDFLFHYPRQNNALWWGKFPASATPAPFGTSSL